MSTKKYFIFLFVLIIGIVDGKKKKTTPKAPLVKSNIDNNTNNNDNTGLTPFCNCASVTPNFGSDTDIPQNPCVPTLAYDQKSIWITWNRPDNTDKELLDYNVYMNGNKIGSSSENANNYAISAPYINNFHNVDKNKFHVLTLFNSFYVDNLEANTLYKFTIRAVYSDGESEDSVTLTAKTAQNYAKIIDITEKGANGDGKTINTDAIQGAINNCGQTSSAFDCKVLVPEGTFISGALFIQTPLTLELAEGAILQGSGESSDFPKNKGRSGKPPSLLNVIDKPVTNLRITGKGSFNGNGWETDQVLEDEVGNEMPIYSKGDSNDYSKGILARSQLSGGVPSKVLVLLWLLFVVTRYIRISHHRLGFVLKKILKAIINNRVLTYAVTNGDGIDLGGCSNVQILNNLMDTGDDAFALSAGAGRTGENGNPTECILIRNNYIRHSHGAPSAGSHTAAWIKNLLVEYNVIVSASNGIRCKSSPPMGGGVMNAVFRNIAMLNVGSKNTANLGNIQLDGITEEGCAIVLTLNYLDETSDLRFQKAVNSANFEEIEFSEITIDNVNKGNSGPSILMEGYDKSQTNYPKTYLKNIVSLF
ncbi:unnamed protein product [Meloidogyne enterolobii]|uniref:Uncharacterized protein n=1 Tax=Meloidogyne enterolobii TaxID=390850 RepID=A0ACB0XS97_MELEN